jgi:hypothetical protein
MRAAALESARPFKSDKRKRGISLSPHSTQQWEMNARRYDSTPVETKEPGKEWYPAWIPDRARHRPTHVRPARQTQPMHHQSLLTVGGVVKLFSVSDKTIRRRIEAREIPYFLDGSRKKFDPRTLRWWLIKRYPEMGKAAGFWAMWKHKTQVQENKGRE